MGRNEISTVLAGTEQAIFRDIYLYTYMHAITMKNEEAMNLKENGKGIWGGLEGGKEREKYN